MAKQNYRDISGIVLLDKPLGLSSNQALQRVRRLYNARKAGHTGSLDPLATGLLPICLGEATKVAGYLLGSSKAYEAGLRLGATTTTDDAEGEVVSIRAVPALSAATIEFALSTLRGRITQTPPAYSAIKQGGVALYKRVRRGEDVQVPAREVDIFRLDVLGHEGDELRLHVECGSGTYVRSIARDLGERLGCGAHLTSLRRIWVDPFREPVMYRLTQLERRYDELGFAGLDSLILPLENALGALPALRLAPEQALAVRQGKRLVQADLGATALCRALDVRDRLVALVEIGEGGEVRVVRGFANAST